MPTQVAAIALAALMAGPFAKPNTVSPHATQSAVEAEAQKQLDYALDTRLAEEARVQAIADRLLRANADLCPETRGRLGFTVMTSAQFKGKDREAAVRRWGPSDDLQVIALSPGGAAEAAGLKVGDRLVSLNGAPVEPGDKTLQKWSRQLSAAMDNGAASVKLAVRRDGQTLDLDIAPQRACAYDVVLDADSADLNAYADGKRIIVTRPMYRLASSDPELALVIGHELAHNAKHHMNAKRMNQAVGMLGGAAIDVLIAATTGVNTQGAFTKAGGQMGAGLYSPEFETEADYVGMYFMARAGFPTEGAENFWRKMAAEHPEAIFQRGTHPPTPERYLAIAATRDEINAKATQMAALTPNDRSTKAPATTAYASTATPAAAAQAATLQAATPQAATPQAEAPPPVATALSPPVVAKAEAAIPPVAPPPQPAQQQCGMIRQANGVTNLVPCS